MQTKQELEVSIGKLKERVKDDKTPPAIKKTLQMAIDKAQKQLGELIEAEKLAKSPKVTPKQADKIDDVKQDSKDMVADLKAKLSKVKAKTKKVALTNDDRKRVSKQIRKKQGLSTNNNDVERDASRPALPKGMRISKNGNKYYEYRENRIDRRPQKYAKLEEGGIIAYADNDLENRIGAFSSKEEAKKFAKANKYKYETITFEDEGGDTILVSKGDSFKDVDWLFSNNYAEGGKMANGGYPIFDERKPIIKQGYIVVVKDTEEQAKEYVSQYPDLYYEKLDDKWAIKKSFDEGGEVDDDKELYNVSGERDGVRVIISKKPLTKDEANELMNDAKRSGLYQNVMLSDVDMYGGEMKRGGKTDYKYVPNQQIAEVTVEKNGKETIIDGSKVLDGIYVKGGVRFMEGGDTMPEKEYMVFYRSSNPAYVNDKGFGDNPPDIYYADSMFEVMEYLKENMPSDVEIAGIDECEVTAYGHGGSLQEQNYEMLLSKVKEVKHHAEELEKVARQNKFIDAWVVAKATRSATDLSDITHYLDGKTDKDDYEDIEDEDEMKMGGAMERYANGGRVMAQYEKVEGTNYELKIQVFYNMGGMNYFNYKNEERGYYLSVTPVQVERQANGITIESYMAFSGVKELLLPVKRKSEKAEQQAIELAKDRIPVLKQYILDKMKSQEGYMEEGGMMANGGGVESGEASIYVELEDSNISVFHGEDYELNSNPIELAEIKNAKSGSWDKIWETLRKLKSSKNTEQGGASILIELKNGNIVVYHGDSVREVRRPKNLLLLKNASEGSWDKIWETLNSLKSNKMATGGGVKYPTELKVGSVLQGVGFPMLKGIDGGNYYTVVEMDDYSATVVKSDSKGNKKRTKKVRHKLDSIEGKIKTATRGDENGILVVKYGMGGKTSFKDKVNAISKRLEGTKVPKRLQKDYGKTYNKKESKEAGKRIAGSMRAKYGI